MMQSLQESRAYPAGLDYILETERSMGTQWKENKNTDLETAGVREVFEHRT